MGVWFMVVRVGRRAMVRGVEEGVVDKGVWVVRRVVRAGKRVMRGSREERDGRWVEVRSRVLRVVDKGVLGWGFGGGGFREARGLLRRMRVERLGRWVRGEMACMEVM